MKRFLSVLIIVPLLCSCMKDFSGDIGRFYADAEASALFSDPAFAEYCLDNFDGSASGVKDGYLQPEEIQRVRTMDCSGLGIRTLDGIEVFISLDTLVCRDNSLVSLDMNRVPALRYLDCSGNPISELNVSQSDISTLFCCPMIDPDTGGNALQYLYVRRGQNLPFITSNRDKADPKRIPDETMVIAIPESKDESF